MAVVAPSKLHDEIAAREAASQADGAHRRFGAARHEPHHFDGRHGLDDEFGEFRLAFARSTVARSVPQCGNRGFEYRRVIVPEDHRPPGTDEVEVAVTVDVEQVRAVGAGDGDGAPADAAEGAGGAIHATGNHATGSGMGLGRLGSIHRHLLRLASTILKKPCSLRPGPSSRGSAPLGSPCRFRRRTVR